MSAAVCFIPATTNSNNQNMVRSQNNWEWQQHHSPPEDDEDDNVDYREGKVSHYNKQASSSWAYIYITPSMCHKIRKRTT